MQVLQTLVRRTDFQKHPIEWHPYLHAVKKLQDRDLYYYVLIINKQFYDIDSAHIKSHSHYLAYLP